MDSSQSSISDYEGFKSCCIKAACDDDFFKCFRVDPHFCGILEHVSPEQACEFLLRTLQQSPHFIRYLDHFRKNDAFGGPTLGNFGPGIGVFAPSTLRYVKVLSDLSFLFGDLKKFRIVEIGGGYGGQCAIISQLFPFSSYTIIDLPETTQLQNRYLQALGVKGVTLLPYTSLSSPLECDLLISNYALCEIKKPLADKYLELCVRYAARGYMTCNQIDPDCYTHSEFLTRIPAAISMPELPLTHPDNYILVWKSPCAVTKPDPFRPPPEILLNKPTH